MIEKTTQTKAEKTKAAILSAATQEFIEHGYDNASTNSIAQQGGISKGLIFHYFQNKQSLFIACLDQAYNSFETYVLSAPVLKEERDIFSIILKMGQVKSDYFQYYQNMNALFADAQFMPDTKEYAPIRTHIQNYTQRLIPKLFDGINWELFRKDVDRQAACAFVIQVMTSLSVNITAKYGKNVEQIFENMPDIIAELSQFTDFLKYGVYQSNKKVE